MYKIIGADQKEYGPIPGDHIRQWIAESRLNGQTQVRLEGEQEWKPLSSFPEFADALGEAPPAPVFIESPVSQAAAAREGALKAVKGPAIALKATAILGLFLVVLGFTWNILTLAGMDLNLQQFGDPQMQQFITRLSGGLGIVQNVVGAVIGVVLLIGASRMQSLRNYQFALTASILAMLPCISPCCVFGLPFGIWALVVLLRPEVKSQFS
jgi:hypothetical protein